MDVADFTTVRFIGLDVQSTVRIPKPYSAIFAAAQAIFPIPVKPGSQYCAFMPPEHVSLLPRQIPFAHPFAVGGTAFVRRGHPFDKLNRKIEDPNEWAEKPRFDKYSNLGPASWSPIRKLLRSLHK